MEHRILEVKPKDDYIIQAVFYNGEMRQYDVKRLFESFPQFKEFEENRDLFESVTVDVGGYGISWSDELDLSAETIWEEGTLIEVQQTPELNYLLAYSLASARERVHLTQKQLAEKTGIYQADISKIERGIGNPSLSTLKRLADGLGMELKIDFVVK